MSYPVQRDYIAQAGGRPPQHQDPDWGCPMISEAPVKPCVFSLSNSVAASSFATTRLHHGSGCSSSPICQCRQNVHVKMRTSGLGPMHLADHALVHLYFLRQPRLTSYPVMPCQRCAGAVPLMYAAMIDSLAILWCIFAAQLSIPAPEMFSAACLSPQQLNVLHVDTANAQVAGMNHSLMLCGADLTVRHLSRQWMVRLGQ